eukprot:TRINITY_DN3339_c2_g2_i3.p1 TRINITY_DN3339_c2_g2~~TRINITY_DN3339_c2_g2_i3.p1  ORF type:complete len:184 (-),score=63.47 TRINITY_DN3339_c2_g2_i3:80-631(-)
MSAEQLNNLRTFNAKIRFQKAVAQLKAHQVSPETVKELRTVFKKTSDADGNVEMAVIRDKIRRLPSMADSMDEVMRVLWKLEKGTGKVRFTEFVDAMVKRHEQIEEDAVRAIFDVFDFDGGGSISEEEIDHALGLGGEDSSWKAGMEVVFGIPAGEIRSKFTKGAGEEYSFSDFLAVVKSCAL